MRHANISDICEGDTVLLQQRRENKLSPTFEPNHYKVIQKHGNAVLIEDPNGVSRMRNAAHMKKLITHDTTNLPSESNEGNREQSLSSSSNATDLRKDGDAVIDMSDQHESSPTSKQSNLVMPTSPVPASVSRPRHPPTWLNDYVKK